jgi:prepilin-type N-terminal cleavage/methylation domain-containing protein
MTDHDRQLASSGMSLLELLVVLSILLSVVSFAIPHVLRTADAVTLRNAANNLGQLLQRGRSAAITDDHSLQLRSNSAPAYAWVDENNDGTLNAGTTENSLVLQLPRRMSFASSGAPALGSMGLNFTVSTALPAFNARGLPCTFSGSSCPAQGAGFVFYISQSRPYSSPGWAAVTISPAGRVHAWVWDGNAWQ